MAAQRRAYEGRARPQERCWDAEWIAQLLEHGLLAPSFVPPPKIRRPAASPLPLMGDRTRDTVRLELILADASIKLSSVASSLKTVSTRSMLTAVIAGEHDPTRLAEPARGGMPQAP